MRSLRPPYDHQFYSRFRTDYLGNHVTVSPATDFGSANLNDTSDVVYDAFVSSGELLAHFHSPDDHAANPHYLAGIILPFDQDVPGTILQYEFNVHLSFGADAIFTGYPVIIGLGVPPEIRRGPIRRFPYRDASMNDVRRVRPLPVDTLFSGDRHFHLSTRGMVALDGLRSVVPSLSYGVFVGISLTLSSAASLNGIVHLDAWEYDDVLPVRLPIGL